MWNTCHRAERVLQACKQTLADLQLEYLDLYLIHWPVAYVYSEKIYEPGPDNFPLLDNVPIQETWRAMEDLVEKGLVKHIGVSNFPVILLNDLLSYAKIKPAVDQVELHPYNQQNDLINFCTRRGIHVTAYSPLARQGVFKDAPVNILIDPVITSIASKHKKTPAQVALRWQIQRSPNISVIPKSVHKERIKENMDIFEWSLDEEDMKEIAKLDRGYRACDPRGFINVPVFS